MTMNHLPQTPYSRSNSFSIQPPSPIIPVTSSTSPTTPFSEISESRFIRDLRSITTDFSSPESERISRLLNILDARAAWITASEAYHNQRDAAVLTAVNSPLTNGPCIGMSMGGRRTLKMPGKRICLSNLPDDILLTISRNLDAPSLCSFEACSRKIHALIKHYSQSLWRHLTAQSWGIPMSPSDARLCGYFLPDNPDWKTIYEERHNLYTGQYRFRMVADLTELDSRPRRQKLVEEKKDIYARKNRRYILHCGQPTTAGSGYAVNLRLCGPYMCWISGHNLAVCKVDGHTPTFLEGHNLPLVTLTTNQRNLVVTGAEDNTMRVWDLATFDCIHVIGGVDVLDCAIHENILVSYNNDNIIDVWDVKAKIRLTRIDVRKFEHVDPTVLTREVKIAVWGDTVVCGFENTVFLVISRIDGTLRHTLSEPTQHHREEYDSTHYPTVLAMYDNILVSRGVRCHEICVWDLHAGVLLYRLSESLSFQSTVGYPIRPNEVITDFTLDARGSFLMCTVENEGGDVYLLAWDFRKAPGTQEDTANMPETVTRRMRRKEKERRFEKRSLESVAGDIQFEYTNFWLCYEI
ncbi:uncharacterized protein SPPG_03951 [Spizellomyces punctatus DAOM BR117]|uniref:F-box domain-containing protein n=1 Tax=Spizellomyces punctatus (strain DAOM BR117) TaxID=645134 RepID=A0A0L0HI94_SPIPD|nr:uncharacterized protein SPPG_03951 [Spizellomyces punctatus DAOM BR117]KND00847.1 hypothetical protein SPPG_03951 [Spizellomyces punctatus DAOM BR117]|eukprot:XP_016608886.1 hypothetical protein SPPG_03951 [Spizellomyces punctatus DAOM BR117]